MIVEKTYKPSQDTLKILINKDYYTLEHLKELHKLFIVNFNGREFVDIDSKFKEVVRKEFAKGKPQPEIEPSKPVEVKSDEKIESDTKKSQEVKAQKNSQEAIHQMVDMCKSRWGDQSDPDVLRAKLRKNHKF